MVALLGWVILMGMIVCVAPFTAWAVSQLPLDILQLVRRRPRATATTPAEGAQGDQTP